MPRYLRLFFFLTFFSYNCLYAEALNNIKPNFHSMSCNSLLLKLIKESSFNKTFTDLDLTFGFERDNVRYIGIIFAKRLENNRYSVYANCELDLINQTLSIIDQEQPIPIKINKKYIPWIKTKCSSNENVYLNTAKLPD